MITLLQSKIHYLTNGSQTKKTVGALCYGHFSILHPGHFRYLEHAASKGIGLAVLIKGDKFLDEFEKNPHFTEQDRAQGLAALSYVDEIFVQSEVSIEVAMKQLQPDILFLGREFEISRKNEIILAVNTVEKLRGRVEFHAGETHYSPSSLKEYSEDLATEQQFNAFKQSCFRQNLNSTRLIAAMEHFKNANIIVIGDTIIDQYVACDALGMSAEAPVIVLRELEEETFLGGAAIVASHIAEMGSKCHFISVIGDDEHGSALPARLEKLGVTHNLIIDDTRPTTFKIRYMVERQKMFRISRLREHNLSFEVEQRIIDSIEKAAATADGILISDFVYGCVTPNILNVVKELSKRYGIMLFGDVQCSSQMGNVLRFNDFNLVTPTEREARISLGNKDDSIEVLANTILEKTNSRNVVLKLGSEGFITYETHPDGRISREHFPALTINPVDVAGAGDSLLATLAVGLCSGASIMEAAAIGTCVAAKAVNTIGNKPISPSRISEMLKRIGS